MWRQKSFAEYSDSDQSISEEEESVSLRGVVVKKEEFQILSQLERRKGNDEQIHGRKSRNLSYEREECLYLDDGVEMPINKNDLNCSLQKASAWNSIEDIITNDKFKENVPTACGNKRQDGSPTWSTINKEAEALVYQNKAFSSSSSRSVSSKIDSSGKGNRGKAKPKFSFHFQPYEKDRPHGVTSNNQNHAFFNLHKHPETESNIGLDLPMECPEDIDEENEQRLRVMPAEINDYRRKHSEKSIVELLDGLQDHTSLQSDGVIFGETLQIAVTRDVLSSDDTNSGNEDSPKSMNSNSSSNYEEMDQNLKCIIQTSRQTIADKFEKVLGATSLDIKGDFVAPPESLRIGLFGKLQQVLQREKLRDVDFLDMLHSETTDNEEIDYLDVKILEKDLEARLVVCSCSFYENLEGCLSPYSLKNMKNGMKKRRVIFNPRVCNNVDLEVASLIRIHAPWKEIKVGNEESTILSTYFSHISSLNTR